MAGRRDPADVRAAASGTVTTYRRHQPVLVALNEMAAYDPVVGATYRDPAGHCDHLDRVLEFLWPGRPTAATGWGLLVADVRKYIATRGRLTICPALTIVAVALATNHIAHHLAKQGAP